MVLFVSLISLEYNIFCHFCLMTKINLQRNLNQHQWERDKKNLQAEISTPKERKQNTAISSHSW